MIVGFAQYDGVTVALAALGKTCAKLFHVQATQQRDSCAHQRLLVPSSLSSEPKLLGVYAVENLLLNLLVPDESADHDPSHETRDTMMQTPAAFGA